MSAAKTTVAHGGSGRRSRVTLLAAVMAALLAFAGGTSVVFADQPQGQPTADPAQPPNPADLTPEQQRVENVIAAAKQYLGVPYRVGSEGPSLFDCSGLVFRAFSDAGLADRVGSARLRAAGYMHWFNSRGQMTTDESQAQRGDLVIYNNGTHIAIYLGDGRAVSALLSGVTVHSVHGVGLPVTGFLRPDWTGDGNVAPFVPVVLPDVPDLPEEPATLVPAADWMTLDTVLGAPAEREGNERLDLRTLNSRTFANKDGTFTTEFHVQPIFYQPAGTTDPAELLPIDLNFVADETSGFASVTSSPVVLTTRPANDPDGFVSAAAGDLSVTLALATDAGMDGSKSTPQILDGGRVVDFFDFQPQQVGLRVQAQPDGFKAFLVLGKTPDRNRFSFVLNAPGLTPVLAEDGSVMLTNADGATMGRIPLPPLLDSSDVDGNGGGVFTAATSLALDTTGPLPVLTVAIDRAFLAEAVMPAYVDLTLTEFPQVGAGADIAFASSAHPNASLHGFQRPESAGFDELWLGRQPDSRNDNEVFVRFAGLTAVLGTVDVAAAALELLPYVDGAEDGSTLVSRVTTEWSADALTWMTRPVTDLANAPTATGQAGAWTAIDVSSYVTDLLSNSAADYGLALSSDESAAGTWTRLAASDAGDSTQFGPRLVVTWSGLRPNAAAPATPAALTLAPTLNWTLPQLAGAQQRFQVELSRDAFTTVDVASGTVKGAAGKIGQWMVPQEALATSGNYSWRVRFKSIDGSGWSQWSTSQTFTLALPLPRTAPHNAVV